MAPTTSLSVAARASQAARWTLRQAQRWPTRWGLLALGLLALGLRVWGAGWSLPYVDHPDEPAVVDVLINIVEGDLNPRHFFYPSLVLYLQALVLAGHLWLGLQTGLYSVPLDLPRSTHFYTTIPVAFVWLRLFSGLLGTAAVVALAAWGGRLVGSRAGLLAGALLALSPWASVHAHYITVDGPAALFALLALLATLHILERATWRDYLLAGGLLGLAVGSKYQNALVAASLLLAHLLHWRGAWFAPAPRNRLVGAGALATLVFLLTSPYILLDLSGFLKDMRTLFSSYDGSHGDIGHAWPLASYLRFHWAEGLGPIPFLLALVGVGVLGWRRPAQASLLLLFPLLLIVALLRMETHFYRNLLPAQAPLLLLAGVGASALWGYAEQIIIPARYTRRAALVSLALLLLPLLPPALQASARLARPDTRVVAQEWARQTYPGVRIAGELSHPLRWQGVSQTTNLHFLPLRSLDWYREQGYGLLLANAGRRGKDAWSDAYLPLLQGGSLVYSVGGRQSAYLGPRIDLIATGLTPETLPVTGPRAHLGPLRLLGVRTGRLVSDTAGPELRSDLPLRPGDTLGITAFWLAPAPVPPDSSMIFVHLRSPADQDAPGQTLVQRDTRPWQGLFPPALWPPGQLVAESLDLPLPATLPPGAYRLVLGLYNPTDGARFPAFSAATAARLPGDEVELGTVEVVSAE